MLRQGQSLVMTPQLQQAIKLLQLSNLELTEYVDTELERNPLLEREEALSSRARFVVARCREVAETMELGPDGPVLRAEQAQSIPQAEVLVRNRKAMLKRLATDLPAQLEQLTQRAEERASKRLFRLKIEGSAMPWQSVNGALVREGGPAGKRQADFPGLLTRAFVDVVAERNSPIRS